MELKEQVSVCAFMEAAQTNVEPIQKQDHLASPASKSGFISSVWFFPLVGAALVDFSSDRLLHSSTFHLIDCGFDRLKIGLLLNFQLEASLSFALEGIKTAEDFAPP